MSGCSRLQTVPFNPQQLLNVWRQGFVRPASREIAICDNDAAALIDKLEAFQSPKSLVQLLKEGALDKQLRG